MSERTASVHWLRILFAAAFAIRVAAAFVVQHFVEQTPGRLCLIEGDADNYWQLAQKLVRGDDYAVYDPPRRVLRMPGFPLFLAGGMKVVGDRVLILRILLAGVGAAACCLVYRLAEELFDTGTAVRAGLIAAVHPTFVVFSVLLLSETLFAATMLASLIALTKLVRPDRSRNSGNVLALVSGLSIGLATLVRPTWLLVGPGFAVIHWLAAPDRRRAALQGGVLLAALGLTLVPWTLRNAWVTGHFVPTTLWVGPSLYDGLNENATGASDMEFVETEGFYRRLSEYDADRHYRQAALEFVKSHPKRALALGVEKLWRFWNPFPNAAQFGHWAIAWSVALLTIPLLALAAYGGWSVRRSLWHWLIPAAPVLYFSLVHTVFVGSIRYRLPAEYALVVLAAVGWGALASRGGPTASS